MLFVVLLHYNDGKALTYADGLNLQVLYFLESMSICAVDGFILLSAYNLSNTNKRKLSKGIELYIQLVAVRMGWELIHVILGKSTISIKVLLGLFLPTNYYVTLYIALYYASPYLNIVIEKLKQRPKSWKPFLAICFGFLSIYPTLVDLFEEIIGREIMGLSTIGAWGSQQGFTLLNFILVYFVGGAIRCFEEQLDRIDFRKLLLLQLSIVVLIYLWSTMGDYLVLHGLRSAWCYHNPMVILEAIILIIIMKRINIRNQKAIMVINYVGKSTYTGYLIHAYILSLVSIQACVNKSVWLMLVSIFILEIITVMVSILVYSVWIKVTDPIFTGSIRKSMPFNYYF